LVNVQAVVAVSPPGKVTVWASAPKVATFVAAVVEEVTEPVQAVPTPLKVQV
jgi:hypothetical protein